MTPETNKEIEEQLVKLYDEAYSNGHHDGEKHGIVRALKMAQAVEARGWGAKQCVEAIERYLRMAYPTPP